MSDNDGNNGFKRKLTSNSQTELGQANLYVSSYGNLDINSNSDINKTNSKTPVPKVSPLREELKQVYKANGGVYNANSHLEKIYQELNEMFLDNNSKLEENKEKRKGVIDKIVSKRKSDTPVKKVRRSRRLK
jgi:hypothetical protein